MVRNVRLNYQNVLCDNFFLWNLGEPTIACLKVASRVLQGLPGGVVAWCVGDSGGLERGLSCCRWLHGWCLGLTCTKGLQTLKYKAMKQEQTKFLHGKGPPIYENKRAWVKIVNQNAEEQTNENTPASHSAACGQLWCVCRQWTSAFVDEQLPNNSGFRVALSLAIKASPGAQPFLSKRVSFQFCIWLKSHFTSKDGRQDSFWEKG